MNRNIIILILLSLVLGGCAKNVSSWEKRTLAKSQMQEGGGHTLLTSTKEQIFISKEATRGGSGAGGGGCGCK